MIPSCIVLFFAVYFVSLAHGGSVSIASIQGVYSYVSISGKPALPFCTSRLDVRGGSGMVPANELLFNGQSGACTQGSWSFVLSSTTAFFTNTTGSVSNLALADDTLICGNDKILGIHFYPTVNPTIILQSPRAVSIRGGIKYILLVGDTAKCLYQEAKGGSNPTTPRSPKASDPLDAGGVPVPEVPKSKRPYLKWLIPLIVVLAAAPFIICGFGLWRAKARRRKGDVAESSSPTQSTSKPNQPQSVSSTHYSQTSHSPHHSPAPHSRPGSPPYYPASPTPPPRPAAFAP